MEPVSTWPTLTSCSRFSNGCTAKMSLKGAVWVWRRFAASSSATRERYGRRAQWGRARPFTFHFRMGEALMSNTLRPILLVEDDPGDVELIKQAFDDGNL